MRHEYKTQVAINWATGLVANLIVLMAVVTLWKWGLL